MKAKKYKNIFTNFHTTVKKKEAEEAKGISSINPPPPASKENKKKTLRFARLLDGTVIKPRDFVELELPHYCNIRSLQSSDFVSIKSVVQDVRTGDMKVKGH